MSLYNSGIEEYTNTAESKYDIALSISIHKNQVYKKNLPLDFHGKQTNQILP